MCAAHDEIDQIHESETKARERVEEAEKRARVIREEADKEAKALIAKAEQNAKQTASKMLSDVEGKKSEIESKIIANADKTIEDFQKIATKKQDEAGKAVYSLIVGED
jgi:vacuolar-type H+-ATPase subunit H